MSKEPNSESAGLDIASVKALAFKSGKLLLLRHFLGFAVNFSCGIVLARFLGPEILGLYFISYTLFIILRQFIDFGIGTHLIRLPSNPASGDFKTAFTIQQFLGLISVFAVIAFVGPFAVKWYGRDELLFLMISAGVGAYFNSWQSIPLSQLERKMEYHKVGVIEVAEIVVFNAVAVIGAVTGMGILGLALGNVLRGLIPAFMAVFLTGLWPAFSKDKKTASSLAQETLPIVGSNLILWLIMFAPHALVGTFAGIKALGIAQLVYSLLGTTMFIATIFQRVSLTSLAKFQDNMESFNKAVQQVLNLLFIIYIPLTMGIASFSPWWVPLIYGEEWADMDKVMLIAAIPVTASALFLIILSALLSKGLASVVFRQNIIHAVIYWSVMAVTVAYLGALSVPVAHLAAMSAVYVFISGYAKHCGYIDYKPLAAGFAAGILTMMLSWFAVKRGNFFTPLVLWPGFAISVFALSSSVRRSAATFLGGIRGI